jgi:uncharacterized protein YjiS (DUF1127 family)
MLTGFLPGLPRLFGTWRRRIHERSQLAAFDDRDLRDIGITRLDVARECNKPFWRK